MSAKHTVAERRSVVAQKAINKTLRKDRRALQIITYFLHKSGRGYLLVARFIHAMSNNSRRAYRRFRASITCSQRGSVREWLSGGQKLAQSSKLQQRIQLQFTIDNFYHRAADFVRRRHKIRRCMRRFSDSAIFEKSKVQRLRRFMWECLRVSQHETSRRAGCEKSARPVFFLLVVTASVVPRLIVELSGRVDITTSFVYHIF